MKRMGRQEQNIYTICCPNDFDTFAEESGISRKGAINLLVAQGLREEGYRDPPRQRPHSPWGGRFDGE